MNTRNLHDLALNVELSLSSAYEKWLGKVGPDPTAALCFGMGMAALGILRKPSFCIVVRHDGALKPLVSNWGEEYEEALANAKELGAALREMEVELVEVYQISPATYEMVESEWDGDEDRSVVVHLDPNLNLEQSGISVTNFLNNMIYLGTFNLSPDLNLDRIYDIGEAHGFPNDEDSNDTYIYNAFKAAFDDSEHMPTAETQQSFAVAFNHFLEDHEDAITNPSGRGLLWDLAEGAVDAIRRDLDEGGAA